jgi:hypothetical protein
MTRIIRRLTLLEEEASERIKIMLKVNLNLSLSQHVKNVLIKKRSKNMILGEPYEKKEKRLYLLINELN